jgi:hypothetical protein
MDWSVPVVLADKVLPDIGRLAPESARAAIGVPARRRTVEGDLGVSSSVDDLRAAAGLLRELAG